jgi:hypothetical protein
MTNAGTWNRVVCEVDGPLDPDLLRGLVDGDYGVVVLKGLLPSAEFALGRDRIQRMFHRVSTTQYVNGALTTIGPFLARYLSDVDAYFADAKDADALSTEAGFDLDLKVRDRLREVLGLRSFDTAQQPDGLRPVDRPHPRGRGPEPVAQRQHHARRCRYRPECRGSAVPAQLRGVRTGMRRGR